MTQAEVEVRGALRLGILSSRGLTGVRTGLPTERLVNDILAALAMPSSRWALIKWCVQQEREAAREGRP